MTTTTTTRATAQHLRSSLPVFTVFAANTGVGKTVASTALCRAASAVLGSSSSRPNVMYLKPVQTGFPADSDARCVRAYLRVRAVCVRHQPDVNATAPSNGRHVQSFCPSIRSKVLYTYTEPASPHLTAIQENRVYPDSVLRSSISEALGEFAASLAVPGQDSGLGLALVETAGGVHSPTMSGSLQSDAYRPFRFPSVLVGDAMLGGISTTLSSYEAMRTRGFDVPAVVMFDNPKYRNNEIIARNVDRGTLSHVDRVRRLNDMSAAAASKLWWPFTQHATSRAQAHHRLGTRDHFTVFDRPSQESRQLFDACGSWWTQGVGHGNIELAKAAANAAGRYGHVIFPEAVHEPALSLAERLLDTAGKGWASRVFYTDDGSTATEVALKMAFKKTVVDRNLTKPRLECIGLEGAYHGDTIGAMDVCSPNVYNEQVDWYTGRGLWFDPPTVILKNGSYHVRMPNSMATKTQDANAKTAFKSADAVFSLDRDNTELAVAYRSFIAATLDEAEAQGRVFGALMIEPVILGAGGMLWVDPLFQRELVRAVRNRKQPNKGSDSSSGDRTYSIPVIFDEVFVGMHRLGFVSAGKSLVGVDPDIACYAKCLTGIVPLAVTLASEAIFEPFLADTKTKALLHGHSFTAHPVGCQVALRSMELLDEIQQKQQKDAGLSRISGLPTVDGVLAATEQGYGSTATASIVEALRESGTHNVYARPLGNVLYFMATHETPAHERRRVLECVLHELEARR
ncbi:pyridoxal phosphate-dependent transferase [Entophlyctis helioformis]|nr:pyridoxal phosphate-dependent transferase [Entophlyctis helioformis]